MTKKLIMGVGLPVGILIVFLYLRVSLPLKTIIGVSLFQFVVFLITYPVWKPRNFTFGRFTLMALVVSGTSAAMLLISSWASKN